MNREIKFRGLSGKGEMVFGYITKDLKGSTCYYDEFPHRIHWSEGNTCHNCPVKKGTEGQFTGLHDRNGNPIYEGDIMAHSEISGVNCRAVVRIGVGDLDFEDYLGTIEKEYMGVFLDGLISCNEVSEIKKLIVVGNVHQNKELLEK